MGGNLLEMNQSGVFHGVHPRQIFGRHTRESLGNSMKVLCVDIWNQMRNLVENVVEKDGCTDRDSKAIRSSISSEFRSWSSGVSI